MTKQVEYQIREDVDVSTLTTSYQLVKTFTAPIIAYKVVNESTIGIDISTNGTDNNDRAAPEGDYVWDIRTNHGREQQLAFSIGTSIYMKRGSVAGTGFAYICALNERQ